MSSGDKVWAIIFASFAFVASVAVYSAKMTPPKTPEQVCVEQLPRHLNDYCKSLIKK